ISINKKSNRIDLDAGDFLYHMKAKSHELFYIWVTKLQAHRLYKKNEAAHLHSSVLHTLSLPTAAEQAQRNGDLSATGTADSAGASGVLPSANTAVNTKVSAWLQQSHNPDICVQGICLIVLAAMTKLNRESTTVLPLFTSQLSSSHLSNSAHLGASVPCIPDYVYSQLSPSTVNSPEGKKIQQDIYAMSQRVLNSLKSVHETLSQERQKLQAVWDANNMHQSNTLAQAVRRSSQGPPSVADSAAEYFDASDDILWGSSSEVSDESGLSDGSTTNSEPEEGHTSATRKYRASISRTPNTVVPKSTGRRTKLPVHCPDNSHVGLVAILYNNIGKDLARVSMPAVLNEPINLLQRLCEELEYSELLDTANNTSDPYQRMVYIAAFAISGYSTATFRNRYKPVNPILGETYECIREDRGFRLISEQVCHHPPISACHADSENFSFWQDQRWKNKFWGKSLEILPTGMVNVTLPRYGEHYEWNKVATCIHNVFSQQRYLEHYGEVVIKNLKSNICTCKITFVKVRDHSALGSYTL
uniref:Oxysterol-binding protein n=1 Tax=Neolamprologus brichardi TaxID=32507 RepID=A0A3Q4I6X7_NEOBR